MSQSAMPLQHASKGPAKDLHGAELIRVLSNARSVVIVGASTDPASYGSRPLTYLRQYGYRGAIAAVNPNYDAIGDIPCYRSALDIPHGSIEVAMLTIPARFVAQSLRELSQVGVKAAVVIASGFDAGEGELRDELKALVPTLPMRVIGPNCIGVCATGSSTFLSFAGSLRAGKPRAGSVALITQSGAMGNALMVSLLRRGAGISHWITSGEEVDTGALELAAGLLEDPAVKAVGIFMEGIGDLEWLPRVAELIRRTGKQVHVMKGATTSAGRSAAVGHTGRVVGSADVARQVMADAGIVLQPTMAALADALVAIDILPPLEGGRLAVLSVSGGSGVLTADAIAVTEGLSLSAYPEDQLLQERIGGRVTAITNPMDIGGSTAEVFCDWVDSLARRDDTDAVIAVYARMMYPDEKVADLLTANPEGRKPIILVPFNEAEPIFDGIAERLAAAGVASVPAVERAVAALHGLLPAGAVVPAAPDDHAHVESDPRLVGLEQAHAAAPGLPWSRFAVVDTLEQAQAAAATIGFPMVVKVAGRTIHHRSDVGGVITRVSESTLAEAFARISAIAAPHGDAVMLQHQIAAGFELMVSALRDVEFGPIVSVRVGGVLAEMIDAGIILWGGAPAEDRRRKLRESKVGVLMNGYRGGTVHDLEGVSDLVDRLLDLIASGTFDFVELNPVIVHEKGVFLVDALARC